MRRCGRLGLAVTVTAAECGEVEKQRRQHAQRCAQLGLDATATAAVVSKFIPVFILPHPVFDLSGSAAVQGKNVNKRTIMYATKTVTTKCCLREKLILCLALRPLKA